MWLILRIVVVVVATLSLASLNPSSINLNWDACFLIGPATGISLYFWLVVVSNRRSLEWSDLYSLSKPFFPMQKYPLNFFVTSATSLIFGGLASSLVNQSSGAPAQAIGGTFFIMGIAMIIALVAAKKSVQA